jgi:Capsule assembly protein Wzi/PAP2 superfamily
VPLHKVCLLMLASTMIGPPCWPQEPRAAGVKATSSARGKAQHPPAKKIWPASEKRADGFADDNRIGMPVLRHILLDQKAIWTSPAHLQLRDASWLVPLGGVTAGFLATDTETSRHLSNSPQRIARSGSLSNYGVAALIGAGGGLYVWGRMSGDEHKRETGLLSGEAVLDALAASSVIQLAAGRERPDVDNARGRFGEGGSSFPSDHAAAAWAVAGIIAHEYPGPLTKLLAYGTASAVSASRVTGKKHFPSDVFVSSAIGWLVASHVYRAHHNPELAGDSWEPFSWLRGDTGERNPNRMGSPYVPLDSWIYPAIERLAAMGYIDTAFLGLRPWTRMECARLVDEAASQLADAPEHASEEAASIYHTLAQEFASEFAVMDGATNTRLRIESLYTRFAEISGQPLTDGYHFGQTITNDFGRPYEEGFNAVSGFSTWTTAGPFSIYIRAEIQHAPSAPAAPLQARQFVQAVDGLPGVAPSDGVPRVDRFQLLDAYVAMNFEDWQVSFGKQSLWWGPSKGGPFLFSDNAEPITMFRISRVAPLQLPWIFSRLGPVRMEFFTGQLAGQHFVIGPTGAVGQFGQSLNPQPFISGQKFSFKPSANFEFSVSRTVLFAGAGVPFTLRKFAQALFSTNNGPPGSATDPGDRRDAVDFTYRIPKLRDWVTFYGDAFTEDEFSPLAYPRKSAMQAGIYLARIPGIAHLDFRAEGGYTEPPGFFVCNGCFYTNDRYVEGYTANGNLLGSWLGRSGQGEQAWTTYWFTPQNRIQATFRHQKVSSQFIPQGATLNDFGVSADFRIRRDMSLSGAVQYENWRFPILAPSERSNAVVSFQLTYWPKQWGTARQ